MLPPHELRGKEFSHTIRGYSIAEVDEHIAFLLEKYTELYRANDALERELQETKARLAELEVNSDAIRRAMVNAQREEHKIITEAEGRADLIMRTAKSNCDRVLVDFRQKIRTERLTLHKLRETVAEFRETALKQFQTSIRYIEELAPRRESEPEWTMTEEEYAAELLEQMKLDIASSAKNSYTEEAPPADGGEGKKTERKDALRRPPKKAGGKAGESGSAAESDAAAALPAADLTAPAGILDDPEELAALAAFVGSSASEISSTSASSAEISPDKNDALLKADTRTFDSLPEVPKKRRG